jgi:hypothetical protein
MSYSLLSCLSLLSLYHRALASSTFASTTIDAAAAAASSAVTDPSDTMTPGELTILSSDGGELETTMSVGDNSLRGIITTTKDCVKDFQVCIEGDTCCGGESCLNLYDDIDFTFDNILLLCDS